MAIAFDRIIIAVPDLPEAAAQYRLLLGAEPHLTAGDRGGSVAWIGLSNTVIELEEGGVAQASIRAIVVRQGAAEPGYRRVENPLELDVYCCDGLATGNFRSREPASQCADLSVDHLVLRTHDAAACIELFARNLGIRLALDQTVPEWGGRMLFFRAGKLTLEVIESDRDGDKARGSFFWGLAFQCADIAQTAARLRAGGVELSDIRNGRKPGTRVATLKSHDLGIPTLLIEPAT